MINNKIVSGSVYFRDLNTGYWTGVNENEKYAPASMYKVAVMIAILKQAYDNSPHFLDDQLTIEINKQKGVFTVGQVVKAMITESDNNAKNILESLIKPDLRDKVFSDFGLLAPNPNDGGDTLSTKEYSMFFRVLYNGNYIGPDLSEAALKILAETTFKEGLVAGVPQAINVSHKFGYRIFDQNKNNLPQELSDCGIVYYPKHPYFICIMTKGENPDYLKSSIKDISLTAYTYTDSKFK